jgi:uncharacterized protein (DUF2336 family)
MSPAQARLVHLLGLHGQKVTYEQARDLLDHPDVEIRRALAARDDLEPEIIYYLANDPDTEVRRLVARNDASPAKASLLLAADDSDDVRCEVAERLGRLVPGLPHDQTERTWRTVHQALNLLARDQLPRVRRALAEALKTLPDAPRDVICKLARDRDSSVAVPVLEFSPVLTDDDLIEVIKASPLTASLAAISRRVNVGEEVSKAIVGSGDTEAIAALLRNQSAQIREETLDLIIDAAPAYPTWHDPLVHRQKLAGKAALRIAEFVAESLLKQLAARQDFDSATTAALTHMVKKRLGAEQHASAVDELAQALDPEALALAARQATGFHAKGKLTTEGVMRIAEEGLSSMVIAALAQRARLDVQVVAEVVRSASAKGMLAVAWAGDFSADDAVILQIKVARIPPADVIKPRAGVIDAAQSELEWQLGLFKDAAAKRKARA